ERGLYNDARHLLVSEIAAALNVPGCDAEDMMDVVLFPPGKERPKRTAEEFRAQAGADDDLAIGDDLMGLDGDLPLDEPEEAAAASDESAEENGEEGTEAEEKPKAAGGKKGKAAAASAPPAA